MDHNLSVPVSIPLTEFQDVVNSFDLGLLDAEDPLPSCSNSVTRTTKQHTTAQMGSQIKTCALPKRKKTTHTLSGTSPVLNRDKATQHGPTLVDMATSPHMKWVDYQVIPINAPESPPTSTSSASSSATIFDQDHPVEEYHTRKEEATPNLPRVESTPLPKEELPALHACEGDYVVDMGLFARITCQRMK